MICHGFGEEDLAGSASDGRSDIVHLVVCSVTF